MSLLYDFLAPIAKIGLTWLSQRRLPQIEGELTLPGLAAPVEIIRDRWGIPHIYAQNTADLFFAQGFVHAQERLWQMELNRRTGQGLPDGFPEGPGQLNEASDHWCVLFPFSERG